MVPHQASLSMSDMLLMVIRLSSIPSVLTRAVIFPSLVHTRLTVDLFLAAFTSFRRVDVRSSCTKIGLPLKRDFASKMVCRVL